jgi:hypothetical protein
LAFFKLLRHLVDLFSHFLCALRALVSLLSSTQLFHASIHDNLFIVNDIIFIQVSFIFLVKFHKILVALFIIFSKFLSIFCRQ